jgi:hypothetical protein
MSDNKTIDWNKELVDQLDWQWQNALRPRLLERPAQGGSVGGRTG